MHAYFTHMTTQARLYSINFKIYTKMYLVIPCLFMKTPLETGEKLRAI